MALKKKKKVVNKPAREIEEPKKPSRSRANQLNIWGVEEEFRERFVRAASARGIGSGEYFNQIMGFVFEAQDSDSKIVKSLLDKHSLGKISI